MSRGIGRALGALMVACTLPVMAPAASAQEADFCLRVLHNSDGESQLIDAGEGLEDFGGVARFARVVKVERRSASREACLDFSDEDVARASIILSAGDNFLPGPEFQASLENGVPFFDSIAISRIGYDALTLGNHEFDFGPEVLADFIDGVDRPAKFLSANLFFLLEEDLQQLVDRGRIAPSTVLIKKGRKVGIIGATTELLASVSSPRDVMVFAVAPLVQAEIDRLSALGVDIIILAAHLQSLDENLELVASLDGVDAALAGGGDELLANEGDLLIPGDEEIVEGPYPTIADNGVPVVSVPGGYKYLGVLELLFDEEGGLIEAGGGPIRIAGGDQPDAVRPRPVVDRLVVRPLQEELEELEGTVVAESDVGLDGRRSEIRSRETNLGNLIADSQLAAATRLGADFDVPAPDVAIQNGGGVRNDSIIGPGEVTTLDTFDILPFANFVTLVEGVTPEALQGVLENAVSRIDLGDGRFAQVGGFSFTYDQSAAPRTFDGESCDVVVEGEQIVDVTLDDGTPIITAGEVAGGAPGTLNVATIDFLARGGDCYDFGDGATFTPLGESYQQALETFLEDDLAGQVTATEYPEGGEGRIVDTSAAS